MLFEWIPLPKDMSIKKRRYEMKRSRIILLFIIGIVFIGTLSFYHLERKHTFTITNEDKTVSEEQIQPVFGRVKVRSNLDGVVVFKDVETKEEYVIGYITHGMSETIQLEKGHWYTLEGRGTFILSPINVRIE